MKTRSVGFNGIWPNPSLVLSEVVRRAQFCFYDKRTPSAHPEEVYVSSTLQDSSFMELEWMDRDQIGSSGFAPWPAAKALPFNRAWGCIHLCCFPFHVVDLQSRRVLRITVIGWPLEAQLLKELCCPGTDRSHGNQVAKWRQRVLHTDGPCFPEVFCYLCGSWEIHRLTIVESLVSSCFP